MVSSLPYLTRCCMLSQHPISVVDRSGRRPEVLRDTKSRRDHTSQTPR